MLEIPELGQVVECVVGRPASEAVRVGYVRRPHASRRVVHARQRTRAARGHASLSRSRQLAAALVVVESFAADTRRLVCVPARPREALLVLQRPRTPRAHSVRVAHQSARVVSRRQSSETTRAEHVRVVESTGEAGIVGKRDRRGGCARVCGSREFASAPTQ